MLGAGYMCPTSFLDRDQVNILKDLQYQCSDTIEGGINIGLC